MMRLRRGFLLALVPLLGALAGFAQDEPGYLVHPNHERGLSAQTAYEIGVAENVNLLNGNLVLTLPIGSSYPVGGGFSYGLTLVYNANLWNYETEVDTCDLNGSEPGGWETRPFTRSYPAQENNAGLGWRLSPGQLFKPFEAPFIDSPSYNLVGADGAVHSFGSTLHEGDPADSACYTRDGSYLRMKLAPGQPGAVLDCLISSEDPPVGDLVLDVEHPDGTVFTYGGDG
ncbi:MAG: hypothetical protein KDD47_17780, partial [Acidobacteria bacterium]|nr:hypothetical protein [Acidobacteriota bacterium]